MPAAAQRPDTATAPQCEIIIKLHPQATDGQGVGGTSVLPKELRTLQDRYRLRDVRPLVTRSDRPGTRPEVLRTRHEQRLWLRQLRSRTTGSSPDLAGVYRIRVDADNREAIRELLDACRRDSGVEYAELSHVISICAQSDDPRYRDQWAVAKIAAPEAWDTCTGSNDVVVAVIDTGVDYNHRDLQANIWTNEAELNGLPGVDDDNNGYVDDVHGYNFVYNNSDPRDDNGHGTHVAGIIAAVGNNGLDVAGVCWNARIMAIKILDAGGDGTSADAAPAIYYAVANGADVISLSWGSDEDSQAIKDAIAYAHRQGVIVAAAAGNEGVNVPFYPAAYPGVIAAAATEPSDKRWYLSNYGDWVDIAAPGRDILSLRAAGTSFGATQDAFTTKLSGTSMAAPHVSGACALLLAADPFLTADEVGQMLLTTGDPIAAGTCASNSRLNVAKAIRAAVPSGGAVRFDRPVYAQGEEIGLLLADSDARGAKTQTVLVVTDTGDSESVTLSEAAEAKGVFRGVITVMRGNAISGDGRVQAQNGERIVARYLNAAGHWIEASAHADYEAPALVRQTVETRGPTARIELTASEPTRAEIRYATSREGPFARSAKDMELSDRHSIKIARLARGTTYYFAVVLTDLAGNEAIVDDGGRYYSFETSGDFAGFRVPGVYPTIQAAIDDAWSGDTVWVADGTYSGDADIDIDFGGRAITVRSENGPASCIIDCRGKGRAFSFQGGEGADAVLDGFTITNGAGQDYGGAIRCIASSPTIRNCTFVKNSADSYGGGLCNSYGSSPLVENCTFEENSCSSSRLSGYGGAVANMQNSSPTLRDCTFAANSAVSGAGMANVDSSSPHVIRCTFKGNFAARVGGAVANWDNSRPVLAQCVLSANQARDSGGGLCNRDKSSVTATNCILSGNHADHDGGAVRVLEASVALTNCTISGNDAGQRYGGLVSASGGTLRLEDSIVWQNTDIRNGPASELSQVAADGGAVAMDYCCVQNLAGSLGGIGNIGSDPLFVDAANGDYHLRTQGGRRHGEPLRWVYDSETSPCIDAGNPGRPLGDEPKAASQDPNAPAAANTRIDMGAYGGTAEASLAPQGWMLAADLNNDGRVDWLDLAHLAADWAATGEDMPGDLSRDGKVGGPDLVLLGSQWHHTAGSGAAISAGP